MKKGLIVGFDPGTTAALAILDNKGKLLILLSKRGMKKGEVIDRITSLGKPLLVAGDRYPLPKAVEKLANTLGCRAFHPKKTLTLREKERLVKGFEGYIKNDHEKDALASALHAFKSFKKLLKKVEDTLASLNLEHLYDEVVELLLTEKADNVSTAIEEVLKKKEEPKIEKKIEEKKEDVEKLKRRIRTLERDLEILREHCRELRKKLEESRERLGVYKKRIPRKVSLKTVIRLKRKIEDLERRFEEEKEKVNLLKKLRRIELKGYEPLIEVNNLSESNLRSLNEKYDLQNRVILSDDMSNVQLLNDYSIKALVSSHEIDEKILEKVEFPVLSTENLHIEKKDEFKVVKKVELEEEIKKVRKKGLVEWLRSYRRRKI